MFEGFRAREFHGNTPVLMFKFVFCTLYIILAYASMLCPSHRRNVRPWQIYAGENPMKGAGQAQAVRGHQGSSVNRRYQLSFGGSLWYRRSPLPQSVRLRLICLSALLSRPGRVKFILNGLRWKKK